MNSHWIVKALALSTLCALPAFAQQQAAGAVAPGMPALPALPVIAPALPAAPADAAAVNLPSLPVPSGLPMAAPGVVAPATPALPDAPTVAPIAPLPPLAAPAPGAVPSVTLPEATAPGIAPAADVGALPSMPKQSKDDIAKDIAPLLVGAKPGAEGKQYSYGNSNLSILFLPLQVDKMKEATRAFEDVSAHGPVFAAPAQPTPVAAAPAIVEPKTYPVFYLASIAYDTPAEWSLWISGHKITSHKNETDIKIINVTREGATFLWTPTYSSAISKRRTTGQFATTDAVKNKLAVNQTLGQSSETGAITFSLRQNQTFAVGYFSIFEGYIDSPQVPALTAKTGDGPLAESIPDQPSAGAVPPTGVMPSQINQSMGVMSSMPAEASSILRREAPMPGAPPGMPSSPPSMPPAAPAAIPGMAR